MSNIAKRISSKIVSNDEFYTPREPILELCELLKLPKDTIIWCPFDTGESEFVKVFGEKGYQVMYSHISTGGGLLYHYSSPLRYYYFQPAF